MYTERNFATKKALKDAVARGEQVSYYQPNDVGFAPLIKDGSITLEGPHYPAPHRWYATAEVKNGYIVKVK